MQQITDWLQKLGLGQYARPFAENDITFSILSDLTDQDLKELGVASLGHRRVLLRAITELKGSKTVAPTPRNEVHSRLHLFRGHPDDEGTGAAYITRGAHSNHQADCNAGRLVAAHRQISPSIE